jgi:hypothetical protein
MIRFACIVCGKGLHVEDEHAGKRVRCPNCQAVNVTPMSSTVEHPDAAPEPAAPPHAAMAPDDIEDEPPRRKRRSPDDLPMPAGLIQMGVDALRGKLAGGFFGSVERKANFIGIYGLLAFSPIAAIFGLVALVSKDMSRQLGLRLILFCLLLPVCQYIIAKVRRAGIRIIVSSRSATSSTNILDCLAVLLLLGAVAGLPCGIYLAIEGGAWNAGVVWCLEGLLASFVCLVMAGLALNPAVLNVRLAPGLSAGGEAMGLASFLLKLLLRVAPLGLAVLVAVGFFELISASYYASKLDSIGIFGIVTYAICIQLFLFTAAYLLLYLAFLTYHLLVDVILSIFRIAANTEKPRAEKEASPDPM